MDILQRSLRIMFRNILKDVGLKHKSYSCCVCSVAYAHQMVYCVQYIGPFFLYVDGNDAVIKHFVINNTNIVDYNLYTYPKFTECNTWDINKFCISDPDMYSKMLYYIRHCIKYYNINNVPDLSKIQCAVCDRYIHGTVTYNESMSIRESIIREFVLYKNPSIHVYPNIVWQRPGFIGKILQFIKKLFYNYSYSECLVHSIIRHINCDATTAANIVKDADMFYNSSYCRMLEDTQIISNNK